MFESLKGRIIFACTNVWCWYLDLRIDCHNILFWTFSFSDYPICYSRKSYSPDLVEASKYCDGIGMKVCSLDQLAEAYDSGYINRYFGLVTETHIMANTELCIGLQLAFCACYDLRYSGPKEKSVWGVVKYDFRKTKQKHVYCCSKI